MDLYEMTQKIIDAISEVTDHCYRQEQIPALEGMKGFIEVLNSYFEVLFREKANDPQFVPVAAELLTAMQSAMKAMENVDLVTLADVLEYDFKDTLLKIQTLLQ